MQNTSPVVRTSLQAALLAALCLSTIPLAAQSQPRRITPPRPGSQPSQSQPEPVYTTDRINAVVVSSMDGKPVARVLVTSPDRRMAAITDYEGRFSFDLRRPVPSQADPGTGQSFSMGLIGKQTTIALPFILRKPGYVDGNIILRLPAVKPDGSDPTQQVKIVPAGLITGHVYADSGDLPQGFFVQLRHKNVFNGEANWTATLTAQVNSRGEFRFANLVPGDYKLLAPASVQDNNLPGHSPDSVPGFLPIFYPNADSFDAATVLRIGPGESATGNLTLRHAPFYSVTIPVANLADGAGFYANLLPDIAGLSIGHDRAGAHGYLPDGDYQMLLISSDAAPPQGYVPSGFLKQEIASVHVEVDGKPIHTAPAAFHPGLELPVVVHRDFSTAKPAEFPDPQNQASVWIGLQPLEPGAPGPEVPTIPRSGDDDIRVMNLSEGLFRVDVTARFGYVASLTSGSTDLLREPLRVLSGSEPRPIEITLRDDYASLNGSLLLDPTTQPLTDNQPVFILCIQLDRPQAQPINFATQQMQFPMPNLPPGHYLLLASRQQLVQTIEYRDEDVLRGLLSKGATITLSPNQKADIQIPLMPEEGN